MGTLSLTMNILVGVAGSGKSTVTQQIKSAWVHKRFVVICPDEIREELCNGNRSDQSKNKEVWSTAYDRVYEAITNGYDVIFDATMLNPKKRRQLIDIARGEDMYIIAHVVERDESVIKEQNANRQWKVPEYIIDNMIKSYVRPTEEEGFNSILFY